MQKIGFCDRYGLTKAVLNGTKTMTRRVIKDVSMIQLLNELEEDDKVYTQNADIEIIKEKIARYKLGEVVAVAQQYSELAWDARLYEKMKSLCDGGLPQYHLKGWTNKMFVRPDLMPHQIKITGVRIERLQDITNEDCLKEGIGYNNEVGFENGCYYFNDYEGFKTPKSAFAALINRPGVGRKGLWESNPFSVVYEFQLVK